MHTCNMLHEADRVRLLHMLDAAREARGFAGNRARADLESDSMLLRALVNCLGVIGEAASQVTDETRSRIKDIPWRALVGMRNRLIHAYFDIDRDIVWATVKNNLPGLEAALEKALHHRKSIEPN